MQMMCAAECDNPRPAIESLAFQDRLSVRRASEDNWLIRGARLTQIERSRVDAGTKQNHISRLCFLNGKP